MSVIRSTVETCGVVLVCVLSLAVREPSLLDMREERHVPLKACGVSGVQNRAEREPEAWQMRTH